MKKLLFALSLIILTGIGCTNSQGVVVKKEIKQSVEELPNKGESLNSTDGRYSAYIVDRPEKTKCSETGCSWFNEIWLKDSKKNTNELLVASGDISKYSFANSNYFPFDSILNLQLVSFSNDNNFVYFTSAAWVTAPAVLKVNINTKEIKFVSGVSYLEKIERGEYKGNFLALRMVVTKDDTVIFSYIITDEGGKKIKDLGTTDEEKVKNILGL